MRILFVLSLIVLSQPSPAKGTLKKMAKVFKATLAQAPVDNEVCFSPDEACAKKLSLFLDSAKESLDVAVFDINQEEIVHSLILKSKSLKVRVIVDKRQAQGKSSSVLLLRKAGVLVRYGRQRGLMHDKFVILDKKRLLTGSFNFTNHADQANQENQVYLSTPSILERYKKRFEEMWQDARAFEAF